MKPLRWDGQYQYSITYAELIESMDFDERLIEVNEDSYQGDAYLLVRNASQYGLLTFGWGSCSGCDALQACSSEEEVLALREEIYGSVRWFDSVIDVQDFLQDEEFARTQWWGYGQGFEDFRKELLGLVAPVLPEELDEVRRSLKGLL